MFQQTGDDTIALPAGVVTRYFICGVQRQEARRQGRSWPPLWQLLSWPYIRRRKNQRKLFIILQVKRKGYCFDET
jgi:hypothetical protein